VRLFDPEAYRCDPGAAVRLKELARTHRAPRHPRFDREDEDRRTMTQLRAMADDLAGVFKLRVTTIEPERDGVVAHYGICYQDGSIRIRLRHARTGRLLKESSLVDTLCHELAHLKHFNHSQRFYRYYWKVLDEARRRGFYRPGPQDDKPRQLSLFEDWACGVDFPKPPAAASVRGRHSERFSRRTR
jgi:hypothetical protein